ncbi:MAG: SPFH domain-containing protein [Gammaproteobacteria bacterium]|nr:SPFH domain-containing protein [Gammaproteobacteria bacterium]MDH5652017.1 SPFH domain-containing protein [Gammaproteobacteria bacterium]
MYRYFKGEPNAFVIRYKNGKLKRHGPGLTFWYWPHNTSIASLPLVTQDAPFIFKETTANYQEVSIQGQLRYRFIEPLEAAGLMDFTIDPKTGRYRSKDPEKLVQRVINAVQANTRSGVNKLSLDEALIKVKELSSTVLQQVQSEDALRTLGVVVESLHFTTVKATPEMQKALEADYRESLQQRADLAIYARRKSAVEEESKISNRELDNEVELEQRRRELVARQAENRIKSAEAEAKAMELEAEAETRADEIRFGLYQNLTPQALVGLALKEWAANAGTIGNLTITPDLLANVVQWIGGKDHDQSGR